MRYSLILKLCFQLNRAKTINSNKGFVPVIKKNHQSLVKIEKSCLITVRKHIGTSEFREIYYENICLETSVHAQELH